MNNQLQEQSLKEVKDIVQKSLANTKCTAFIFGSWAMGNARSNSDIDIGIIGRDGKIEETIIENLQEELLESNIPYFFEVVDFYTVSNEFKEVALTKIIPLIENV